MNMLPLIVNVVVILVVGLELYALSQGMATANELLAASLISGLLILMSLKMSKDAMEALAREEEEEIDPYADEHKPRQQ